MHCSNLLDTSQLHENNAQMGARIRQLESALATMQSQASNETHPLLREDLLSLGPPLERPPVLEGMKPNAKPAVVKETIEAFGTLSIGANGRTTFRSQAVSADVRSTPVPGIHPLTLGIIREPPSILWR